MPKRKGAMPHKYKVTFSLTVQERQRESNIERCEIVEANKANDARLIASKICDYIKHGDQRVIAVTIKKLTRLPCQPGKLSK